MICSRQLSLYGDSCGVVDPIQENSKFIALYVLINRLSSPLPVAVVIDDQNASNREFRVEMDQLVLGGLVPVGIEPQYRNVVRGFFWYRILDFSDQEARAIGRIISRQ